MPRRVRTVGDKNFAIIRQFFRDMIKSLEAGRIWVTEEREHLGNAPRGPQIGEVTYRFVFSWKRLGARRRRYAVVVASWAGTVAVDRDLLVVAMIEPGLMGRLREACAQRCATQGPRQMPTSEVKRHLRRLTREFDRMFQAQKWFARRLRGGHVVIACGRKKRTRKR